MSSRTDPIPARWGALVLLAASCLLFIRLGHYALWDDETMVALVAKGVMRTGDTVARIDANNIVAYRGGMLLRHGADRYSPPLATYVTAASFFLFGVGAWAARFPFALLGLGTAGILLWWARSGGRLSWMIFALGLLGNVSFFLYFRQCRYYAPALFFSVVIAYVYWNREPTRRTLLALSGLSVLLFASNCMNYLALYGCLAVDYLAWHRRSWRLRPRDFLLLLGPQAFVNAAILAVWNPFFTGNTATVLRHSWRDRGTLLLLNLGGLDRCETCSLVLVAAAAAAAIFLRRTWLRRACAAFGLYLVLITFVSPQDAVSTDFADTRYLAPLIPLALAIAAGLISLLLARRAGLALAAAGLAFCTNLLDVASLRYIGPRSTIAAFVGELIHPAQDPYHEAARWIRENLRPGTSLWVLPGYAAYPLMFLCPDMRFAWQLDGRAATGLGNLPDINYIGHGLPDVIVAFGPMLREASRLKLRDGPAIVQYTHFVALSTFYIACYRPEIERHAFKTIRVRNLSTDAIFFLSRR